MRLTQRCSARLKHSRDDDTNTASTTAPCRSRQALMGFEICSKRRSGPGQCAGQSAVSIRALSFEQGIEIGGERLGLKRRLPTLCCFLFHQQSEHIEVVKGGSAILKAFGCCCSQVDLFISVHDGSLVEGGNLLSLQTHHTTLIPRWCSILLSLC